jgi:Ca-activated chloride channel family protein
MYWDDTGKVRDSSDPDVWRITDAKQAVRSFLGDITNPRDRIGLITFNVDIDMRVEPTDDLVEIERALERIEKPSRPESYTELYESLYRSIDDIRALKGRKVIILLTDGWNFPKEDNPAFPDRAGIEGAIEYAQEEGISIFTIGLSDGADEESLTRISEQTGGAYFPVFDAARLASLYALIRDQVLGEYLLAYRATMAPAQQKNLRVVYESGPETRQAQRPYFAGTIFGLPWSTYRWEALAAVPAALLVLFLLSLLKSSRRTARPELTILSAGGRKKRLSVPVTGKRAVTISGQAGTDITVAGKGTEKTKISVTRKGGEVTLVSEKGEVTVNNRNVKKKTLRSGDLIKVGDTTVVFDMGEEKKAGER